MSQSMFFKNSKTILNKFKILFFSLFFITSKSLFNIKNSIRFMLYYTPYDQNQNLKSGDLGFGMIHYSIIRNIKPRRVLCIGSGRGFVPAILALACKDNNKGIVDFVDAGFKEEDVSFHWQGNGFWKSTNINKYFNFFKINKFIKTYIMTNSTFNQKYSYKYDYVYIDGDHTYEGVKKDFNFFYKKLNKYGFIVFHDHKNTNKKYGVGKFLKELKQHNLIQFNIGVGLSLLQKT